ncbi:MAG TPA: DUF4139 domain-containing protein [Brevundimonas sp.]|uniref:DUF4139 domain-containing protein n=1 Tax=Brevundimonas sp. TaxID=1871086 RepID=UPI002E0E4692|nr:DUF4139 domain-containing protein [Brevundimonas sp.]
MTVAAVRAFRRLLALTAAATALALPAAAQTVSVSPRAEARDVVIYRSQPVDTARLAAMRGSPGLRQQGLALIVETRTIDVPAGEGVVRFENVADGIITASVVIDGLPARITEQNTDFDLLTPGGLIRRSVGEVVRRVRTNPETGAETVDVGVLRAANDGVALEINGRLEALQCSGQPERLVLDRVPDGLTDQPVLSLRTRATRAGRHRVTLAYLATGLQWSADYVARPSEDGRTLALEGWITLINAGATTFDNVELQLVAGELNREGQTRPIQPARISRPVGCWPMDTTTEVPGFGLPDSGLEDVMMMRGGPVAYASAVPPPPAPPPAPPAPPAPPRPEESDLGDYKLYTLPEPVTVAARQTKQVQFLAQPEVAYTRLHRSWVSAYEGRVSGGGRPQIVFESLNSEAEGLGRALPGGRVLVMADIAGRRMAAGSATFRDNPIGLPLTLTFGQALDVEVIPRVVEHQPGQWLSQRQREASRSAMAAVLRNTGRETVTVEIVPSAQHETGFRILEESHPLARNPRGELSWRITVPAGESVELTWTYQVG